MVAQALVVTGEAKNVANSERSGSQDVALQGQAVSVSDHHLQHGLCTCLHEQQASSQARHAHHSGLVVGHVDGVARGLEQFTFLAHAVRRTPLGRSGFACHGKLTTLQYLFQTAARFHDLLAFLIGCSTSKCRTDAGPTARQTISAPLPVRTTCATPTRFELVFMA